MVVDKGEAVAPVRVQSFQTFLLDIPGGDKKYLMKHEQAFGTVMNRNHVQYLVTTVLSERIPDLIDLTGLVN